MTNEKNAEAKKKVKDFIEEMLKEKEVVTKNNLENTLNEIIEEEKTSKTKKEGDTDPFVELIETFSGENAEKNKDSAESAESEGNGKTTESAGNEETKNDTDLEYICPSCDYVGNEPFDKCPECNQEIEKWEE